MPEGHRQGQGKVKAENISSCQWHNDKKTLPLHTHIHRPMNWQSRIPYTPKAHNKPYFPYLCRKALFTFP